MRCSSTLVRWDGPGSSTLSEDPSPRGQSRTNGSMLSLSPSPSRTKTYPGKSVGLFYDLTSAFHVVRHDLLMQKLLKMSGDQLVNRWIRDFLSGSSLSVRLEHHTSRSYPVRCGVPQGTILGPLLFIVFIDDLIAELSSASPSVTTICYACPVLCHGHHPERLATLSCDVDSRFRSWCGACDMVVSQKSKAAVFARASDQRRTSLEDLLRANLPNMKIIAPSEYSAKNPDKCPSLLGLKLDSALTFAPHCASLCAEIRRRNGQLSSLLRRASGPSTHSTRGFYKAYVESAFLYRCEIWWPLLSPESKQAVVKAHHACLRVVCGALRPAKIEHLYLESDTLPVPDVVASRLVIRHERITRRTPPIPGPSSVVRNEVSDFITRIAHEPGTREPFEALSSFAQIPPRPVPLASSTLIATAIRRGNPSTSVSLKSPTPVFSAPSLASLDGLEAR